MCRGREGRVGRAAELDREIERGRERKREREKEKERERGDLSPPDILSVSCGLNSDLIVSLLKLFFHHCLNFILHSFYPC